MSASKEKKQRQKIEVGVSEQEKQAQVEAAKRKQKNVIYTIIGVVAVLAVAALLIWDSGMIQRNMTAYKVGDTSYTIADVDYYVYGQYNSYYSTYGDYLFDSTKSLKDQDAYEDENGNMLSWYDALVLEAENGLIQATALCDEAAKAGYTLSEEGAASIDAAMEQMKASAESLGVTTEYYLQAVYGPYATLKNVEENMTMYTLATEYSNLVYDNYTTTYTADQIDAYYAENTDSLDTLTYRAVYVNGSVSSTTDEEGNTVEPTEEEEAAAMEAAKALAEQVKTALESDDDAALEALVSNEENRITDNGQLMTFGSSLSTYYSEFLLADGTKAGDVTVAEGTSGYYVVEFISREKDEYFPATYRDITVSIETNDETTLETQLDAAKAKSEELMASVTDEASFIALVAENSSSSTASTEGLNASVAKTSLYSSDPELYSWLFEEQRTAGDMIVLPSSSGTSYRLIYFSAYDPTNYVEQVVRANLAGEEYNTWFEGVFNSYTGTKASGFGQVGKNL